MTNTSRGRHVTHPAPSPCLQTFLKGVPPRHKLLPTGGTVFTTEEKYMVAVDKCFPDDSSTKKLFNQAIY